MAIFWRKKTVVNGSTLAPLTRAFSKVLEKVELEVEAPPGKEAESHKRKRSFSLKRLIIFGEVV